MKDITPANEKYITSFSTANLRFMALDKSDSSRIFLEGMLDPKINPNAFFYGDRKHYGRIGEKVESWGGKVEREKTDRCFIVSNIDDINSANPLGYVNLSLSVIGVKFLEGGALFAKNVSTALQAEALNAVYVQYVENIFHRADPEFREYAENGFVYTMWVNNPLMLAFNVADYKRFHSLGADLDMCKHLGENKNERFFCFDSALWENSKINDQKKSAYIEKDTKPFNDREVEARCGFVVRYQVAKNDIMKEGDTIAAISR